MAFVAATINAALPEELSCTTEYVEIILALRSNDDPSSPSLAHASARKPKLPWFEEDDLGIYAKMTGHPKHNPISTNDGRCRSIHVISFQSRLRLLLGVVRAPASIKL